MSPQGAEQNRSASALLRSIAKLRVRDDIDFLDAEHIGEGVVLAHDMSQWKYTAIGQMDYVILEALDEGNSLADVFGYLYRNYELQVELPRVVQTLEFAIRERLLDLWCYSEKILLSRGGLRQFREHLSATADTHRSPEFAPLYSALEDAAETRDAVAISRVLYSCRGTSAHLVFASLYEPLLKTALPRSRMEFSLLKSRLDLFDPHVLLKFLSPIVGWIHHPIGIVIVLVASGAFALATPIETYAELLDRNSDASRALFRVENFLIGNVVNWGSVFIHELFGHALALAYFGGRVPTIGLMVFFGILPAGFANVSDTYKQPSRWKRVWTGAAGMYIDIVTALVSVGLIRYFEPGSLMWTACAISVIANFGSIWINSMPWLKFDGYYILSDATGQPSLQEDALAIGAQLGGWLLDGKKLDLEGFTKQQIRWGVAFLVGQTTVFASFLPLLFLMLLPKLTIALGPLGFLLFCVVIFRRFKRILSPPKSDDGDEDAPPRWVTWVRYPRSLIITGLIVFVFYVPLRFSWQNKAHLEPVRTQSVAAVAEGDVTMVAYPGQQVAGGEVIAILRNEELETLTKKAELQLEEATQQRNLLITQHLHEEAAEKTAAASRKRLEYLRAQVRQLRQGGEALEADVHAAEQLLRGSATELVDQIHESEGALDLASREELKLAEYRIIETESDLARLRARLAGLTVRAEFPGVVTGVFVGEGDYASEGNKLLQLDDLSAVSIVTRLTPEQPSERLDLMEPAAVVLATGERFHVPPYDVHYGAEGTVVRFGPLDLEAIEGARAHTSATTIFKQRGQTPFGMLVDLTSAVAGTAQALF